MIVAALFTIAKGWKQPIKVWYIHAVEHYLAIKRNEILTHVTTWMNLEDVILSEKSQSQKATYYMIP